MRKHRHFGELNENSSIRALEWATVVGLPIASWKMGGSYDFGTITDPIGTILATIGGAAVGAMFGAKLRGAAIGGGCAFAYQRYTAYQNSQHTTQKKAEAQTSTV